jgi:hypothetical protein
MKQFDERKRGPAKPYSKGDRVWLEATNIRTDYPMKKLDNKPYSPSKPRQR